MKNKKFGKRICQAALRRVGFGDTVQEMGQSNGVFHPQVRRHIDLIDFMMEEGISTSSTVLDVGCGAGLLALRMHGRGFRHIVGVDWVPETALKDAARRVLKEYRRADLNVCGLQSFQDAQFHVVIASDVLEHLENPSFLLREIARVVGRDGHIFLTLPNAFNLFERIKILLSGNSGRYRQERAPQESGHISMFSSNVLLSLLQRAGLCIQKSGKGYCYFAGAISRKRFSPLLSFCCYYHIRKASDHTSNELRSE